MKNIRKSNRSLAIFSTGGRTTTDLQGYLPGYGTVWFHPGGISNILDLSKVAEKYWVSYNSTVKNKFLVYLPKGKIRSFTQCEWGLFYSVMAVGETVLVNTVDYNISKYSKRDCIRALLARKLQYKIALPRHRHLVKIVKDKVQMLNFPLNRNDVRGAEDIRGGNLGYLKGKTPRQKMPHIRGKILPLPTNILERYKSVTLVGDIMFINGIRFLKTISRHTKFMMAEHIANAKASTLQESIRQVK